MPPVFALSPAHAVDGFLDFSQSEHHKIYKSGIRAVTPTDSPFTCEPTRLFKFLRRVEDRANEMGWMSGILDIVTSEEGADLEEVENLIWNYGTLTLEQVVESERRYIALPQRKAQDTYMLYMCLMASLSDDAQEKVMIWADQYQIEIDDTKYNSGVALLKVIIRESHLDTNATTSQIRTKLSSLDMYITTVNCDIGKFNQYVKLLIQSLTARNQSTTDLLINLFKGYSAVSDVVFRTWLSRKQDDHEEGDTITPDELMQAAKNKYDSMVEKGTWNAPTAEEKIVALEAKLTSTQANVKNLNKKVVSFELGKKGKAGGKAVKADQKKKGKDNDGDHPKTWDPPKAGEKKVKDYKGHKWYWCGKDTGGKCEKWRAHEPKECKGAAAKQANGKRGTSDKKGKTSRAKKLKVARAYVAKLEQRSTDDDTSGNETE